MLYNHLIIHCPLLLLLSIFPSIRVFSNELALCIRWPKYWSFSFSIRPSNEYSGLISFRIQLFDLLAVQEDSQESSPALKFKSFNYLALSLLYGTTFISVHDYWKTIALTIWIFDGKVMFLLFNMLFRFAIAFFPRSKHLLFSWLQLLSTVILELKKRKSITASTFSFFIRFEVMGPNATIFVFLMLNFKPAFSLSSFTLLKRLFSSSSFSAIRVVSSAYLRLLIFLLPLLILIRKVKN